MSPGVTDLLGFGNHIFISYAHIDNQPLTADQHGWVTQFHQSLERLLSMRLGRPASIWRDRKLAGNDVFGEEIIAQFPHTALLVSVLSPRYLESDWCRREVQEFCRIAGTSVGLVVGNKSRIIKILKAPVESEDALPPIMKATLGYPFYVFDDERPLELDPAYGAALGQQFLVRVAKLAWDISQQLKKPAATSASAAPGQPAPPTIYLAECSRDQRAARETLDIELRLQGYSLLPDRQLPPDEIDYVAAVNDMLAQSQLAIHLVGSGYGAVPDGPSRKSVVVLQNELAVTQSARAGLRRIIWVAGTPASSEQQQFVHELTTTAAPQYGADLLTGDLESVKAAIQAALDGLRSPKRPMAPERGAQAPHVIYLICDERDRADTVPMRKYLKQKGYEVEIPAFQGSASTIRNHHQDLLTQCDAVVVFYGAGDEAWKRAVDSDVRKLAAYRDGKPLACACTYVSPPLTDDKRELMELDRSRVLDGLAGFTEASVQPLLASLGDERA